MKFVSIIMGSKSDLEVMRECESILKELSIAYEMIISSAHRTPKELQSMFKKPQTKVQRSLSVQLAWRLIWQVQWRQIP